MLYVRLVQVGPYEYKEESWTSPELALLGRFLGMDVGAKNINQWKEWLASPLGESQKSGQQCLIEKRAKTVLISDIQEDSPYEILCELTYSQLQEILDRWRSLCSNNAQEIVIRRDSDKIVLGGSDLIPIK